jgi:hypothetical protein
MNFTESIMTLIRLSFLLLCVLLTSCSSATADFYVFGWGNSCYKEGFNKTCTKIKAYDFVKLTVSVEKQSVSYVKKAYFLDNSNIVYETLENCKVIDLDNFSCKDISRASGHFIDTKIFKNRLITDSFILSLATHLNYEIERDTFHFVNDNRELVSIGIAIFMIIFFAGLSS